MSSLPDHLGAVLDHALFAGHRVRRAVLPTPGIAATGSRSCGGRTDVIPSLTTMTAFRPSAQAPSFTRQPFQCAQRDLPANPLDGLGGVEA